MTKMKYETKYFRDSQATAQMLKLKINIKTNKDTIGKNPNNQLPSSYHSKNKAFPYLNLLPRHGISCTPPVSQEKI